MNRTIGGATDPDGSHVRAAKTPPARPTASIARSGRARGSRAAQVAGGGAGTRAGTAIAAAPPLAEASADPPEISADVARNPVSASSSSPALA